MQYLVRLAQAYETFRKPELESLAELFGLSIKLIAYSETSPFAILEFQDVADHDAAARVLVGRSILAWAIYEFWGAGDDYAALHDDVKQRSAHLFEKHRQESFRFEVDSFYGKRSAEEKRGIIESFKYLNLTGPIVMKQPQNQFMVFEESPFSPANHLPPFRVYFGRLVAESDRKAVMKYDLKKRKYISTTSMNAELSLVTANLALARPGSLAYDPFMATGSFPLSCAHFGATVFGSDMDGRSIRGRKDRSVKANFEQYKTTSLYLGGFTADLTNTPIRQNRILDAIVCDPPYGVREGLKVLGSVKESLQQEVLLADGTLAHLGAGYIPPKKPYNFFWMLDDILDFADTQLVEGGRLCMWMPVAGTITSDEVEDEVEGEETVVEEREYDIPQHPGLKLMSCCTQDFNKWSRRLLTYKKLRCNEIGQDAFRQYKLARAERLGASSVGQKQTSDELNSFRQKYFQGFKT